jgi:hypothetical protein
MVLCNSYNLQTGEPEVKAVVTSTDCRRLPMLNAFLREYKYQTRPTNFVTYVQANVVVEFFCLTARKSLQFKQIRNGRF